eukprot:SAG22_NODE_6007_length_917_cov_0.803178_1_plen_88_part_00
MTLQTTLADVAAAWMGQPAPASPTDPAAAAAAAASTSAAAQAAAGHYPPQYVFTVDNLSQKLSEDLPTVPDFLKVSHCPCPVSCHAC